MIFDCTCCKSFALKENTNSKRWGEQVVPPREGIGGSPCIPKGFNFPLLLDMAPTKKSSSLALLHNADHILGKKVSLIVFRQFLPNILPVACIFSYTIMTYLKKLDGTKTLNTKQCPVGLSPRIIPHITSFLPKWPLLWCCFVGTTLCGLSPLRLNLCGKHWIWGKILHNNHKFTHFPHQKSSLHRFTSFFIKSVIPSPSDGSFHVTTLSKLHL